MEQISVELQAAPSAEYLLKAQNSKNCLIQNHVTTNLHLAEKGIANGEMNDRVNIWQWRALGSSRGPSLVEARWC